MDEQRRENTPLACDMAPNKTLHPILTKSDPSLISCIFATKHRKNVVRHARTSGFTGVLAFCQTVAYSHSVSPLKQSLSAQSNETFLDLVLMATVLVPSTCLCGLAIFEPRLF
jgi:hypothetical protein